MCPRSGFLSRRSVVGALILIFCTVVPFSVPSFRFLGSRNIRQNNPRANPPKLGHVEDFGVFILCFLGPAWGRGFCWFLCFQGITTLTSANASDVIWIWLGCGSDVARTWLGRGSDVAQKKEVSGIISL